MIRKKNHKKSVPNCTTSIFLILFILLNPVSAISQEQVSGFNNVIPTPLQIHQENENICFSNTISIYTDQPDLNNLYEVWKDELMNLAGITLKILKDKHESNIVLHIDPELEKESYTIQINKQIIIEGGSYNALAMASVTLLQSMQFNGNKLCWYKASVKDNPEFSFRGLMIDLARRKHDIATIKRVISLCRFYKINYLQLHLTDENYFTFPSQAFPQLPTKGWIYSREELKDLIHFADVRGVQLIPELEVPGHAGQFVQEMNSVFGFKEKSLNRYTINMGRDSVYAVLDTLIGEIAEVFHSSEYIHIGGDEANFDNMENDPDITLFMKKNGLENINELYWYFLNRMNSFVKKRGKKTIVWEGFSKKANSIIDKDIIVMAWETMYQLPQDILEAGFKTINVSWKPLYVVNDRKWSPAEIFGWNIFRWENWVPSIPSYIPIQLPPHTGIIGASMASWDQPAYTEISSLRKRIPAFVQETWNPGAKKDFETFLPDLNKADSIFDRYLSPVTITTKGLTFANIQDGRKDEQTWFNNKLEITLSAPEGIIIRFSTDGSPVNKNASVYNRPIQIDSTTELRYQAFKNNKPMGIEMLNYYALNPVSAEINGNITISLDSSWTTTHAGVIGFKDSIRVTFSSARKGKIKYAFNKNLNNTSNDYSNPIIIKENGWLRAGLFVNDTLIGQPWIQQFRKE